MEKVQLNPWTWQDAFGFSQGWRVDGPASLVFVAGQGSISPDGELVGEGDIEAQTTQVFENLRAVLERSGGGLDAVVKLNIYLTDITNLRDVMRIKEGFLPAPHPAATAVGVAGLALPGMMIEVEAVAAL